MKKTILTILTLTTLTFGGSYDNSPKLNKFIDNMVKKHNFSKKGLIKLFKTVNRDEASLIKVGVLKETKKVKREPLSWDKYRAIFFPKIADEADKFYEKNLGWLLLAEEEYGVEATHIVATIGIETKFGKYGGEENVLDAITSIAMEHPKRGKFFRFQLEEFLLFSKEERKAPRSYRGSYAGAMGLAQFMPDSIRKYAVDFDKDGIIDLNNPVDAIGSIANFYKNKCKWGKEGNKYHFVSCEDNELIFNRRYLNKKLSKIVETSAHRSIGCVNNKPKLKRSYIKDKGIKWVGTINLKAISRYNPSPYYIMAVTQLSGILRERNRR